VKVSVLTLALAAALAATIAHAAPATQTAVNGRYLVVFKSATLPTDAGQRIGKNGGKLVLPFNEIGVATVVGTADFATKMAKDSTVLAVGIEHMFKMPDYTIVAANDTNTAVIEGAPLASDNLYGYQWDMRRIGAPAVWARLPVAATAPRVAVLDVGVMDNHSDLVGQIDNSVSTAYCTTSGGPSNSAGYPIYSSLIDFDANPNWTPADGCTAAATTYESHGTHVAGTIAAKFGGGRVVGVAPNAKVGAYKVFDRYRSGGAEGVGAFDGPLFAAIIDATLSGYPVISMSLGGSVLRNDKGGNASWLAWNRVSKWADRHGALLIASAGNSAYDLNGTIASVPSDLSTVMSTSASGSSNLVVASGGYQAAPGSDVLAFYSNYGASIDISAPGGDCGPYYPTVCQSQYLILNDYVFPDGSPGYAWFAGTSMATPHVSAVAAYVRSMHPTWTPGDVRSWLKTTAEPLGNRQSFGAGLLNANGAVQ
jgi:subtilisin family serine protease